MKKIISFILAVVMLLSMTACVQNDAPGTSAPVVNNPTGDSGTNESTEPTVDHSEHITLKYVTMMTGDMPGAEAVEEAVNKYLNDELKLNMTLDITFISDSEWADKTNVMLSTGSGWDITVVGGTQFTANAPRNAFYPLNDYVDTLLADAKEMLPEAAWNAWTIDGKIYAVCPEKDLGKNYGVAENQTLLDDLGVTFPADYDTTWDLLPYWRELKQKRDEKYPQYANDPLIRIDIQTFDGYFYFDPYVGSGNGTVVCSNFEGLRGFSDITDPNKVFCPYFSSDFVDWAKAVQSMVKDGVCGVDKTFDVDNVKKNAGLVPNKAVVGYVEVSEDMNAPYYKTKLYPAKNSILTTADMQAGGHVINAKCKYPERAMEFINLLYSDTYLGTTLRFGVEGTDWTDADNDGTVEFIGRNSDPSNRYWYNWYGYWFGSLSTSKRAEGLTEAFNKNLAAMNEGATPSAVLGFIPDTTNIANEIAACNNTISEYMTQFRKPTGSEDIDALVAAFREKLKANGIEKIISEVQAQRDAFVANQK